MQRGIGVDRVNEQIGVEKDHVWSLGLVIFIHMSQFGQIKSRAHSQIPAWQRVFLWLGSGELCDRFLPTRELQHLQQCTLNMQCVLGIDGFELLFDIQGECAYVTRITDTIRKATLGKVAKG